MRMTSGLQRPRRRGVKAGAPPRTPEYLESKKPRARS